MRTLFAAMFLLAGSATLAQSDEMCPTGTKAIKLVDFESSDYLGQVAYVPGIHRDLRVKSATNLCLVEGDFTLERTRSRRKAFFIIGNRDERLKSSYSEIFNVEIGYYRSRDSINSSEPRFVRNKTFSGWTHIRCQGSGSAQSDEFEISSANIKKAARANMGFITAGNSRQGTAVVNLDDRSCYVNANIGSNWHSKLAEISTEKKQDGELYIYSVVKSDFFELFNSLVEGNISKRERVESLILGAHIRRSGRRALRSNEQVVRFGVAPGDFEKVIVRVGNSTGASIPLKKFSVTFADK